MPYFAPNQPDFNHLRHLQLMQWNGPETLSPEEMKYYVAHMDRKGAPIDWFFDSFQIFSLRAPSGNGLNNDINIGTSASGMGDFFAVPDPNPGTKANWEEAIETAFGKGCFLDVLEATVEELSKKLGKPPHKRNVVITIPYPNTRQCAWGRINEKGPRLNFSVINQNLMKASEQRVEACKWFIDQVMARYRKQKYKHVNLLGFYWVYESLHYAWDVDDHWTWKEVYKYTKQLGVKMFWIPFYSSFNVHLLGEGRNFYFDAAFLQPNHMFYDFIKDTRQAAEEAKERGAGIEIEYYMHIDAEVDLGKERIPRFYNYLNGGIKYGYMTESACAYFNGFNDIHKMALHKDPVEREAYDDMCRFVRGVYELKEVTKKVSKKKSDNGKVVRA